VVVVVVVVVVVGVVVVVVDVVVVDVVVVVVDVVVVVVVVVGVVVVVVGLTVTFLNFFFLQHCKEVHLSLPKRLHPPAGQSFSSFFTPVNNPFFLQRNV